MQQLDFEQIALFNFPYLEETLSWIETNHKEWKALQKLMLDIRHEEPWRKRVKRDEICQEARKRGISIDLNNAWEFNHNLWANLARFLIKYHPSLDGRKGGIIHIRSSLKGAELPDPSWYPDLKESLIVTAEEYKTHRYWRDFRNDQV